MSRRISILILLGAVLAGALVIDRSIEETVPTEELAVDATEFPIATAPGELSSTWFCAGGTALRDDPFANHIVDILNPTGAPIEATMTVYGGEIAPPPDQVDSESLDEDEDEDGGDAEDSGDADDTTTPEPTTTTAEEPPAIEPVVQTFTLAPHTRQQAVLAELVTAPVASALVEASGGLVVEHEVVSQHGRDAKPCSTSASTTWHFAWGTTRVEARELLVLFNPFPDDAIVEGVFSTEAGIREPLRFAGFVVPARGTVAVDLGDDVTRRDEVSATITARSGRVVVDRIQRINATDGRGLTVQTGVPEPQHQWVYPYGFSSDAIREEFSIYNPTSELAEVEITTELADPETNGGTEPLQVSIPPGAHRRLDPAADERIPDSVAHRSTVRSANGVPVVAERVQFASGDTRQGISVTTGSPVEATRWFFAAGAASDATDEWLNIVNLDGQVLAEISVQAVADGQLVDVSGLQNVEIGAGARLDIRLGEHISRDQLPVVVTATEPVIVERGLYRTGEARGISNAVGIPAPDGLRLPLNPFEDEIEPDLDLGELEDAPTVDDEDSDAPPTAPDDVELPEPDETIIVDDPDAEADIPDDADEPGDGGDPEETTPTTAAEDPG